MHVSLFYVFAILFIWILVFRKQVLMIILGRQKFVCTRCGHCCRLRVSLTREDVEVLKKAKKSESIVNIFGKPYLKQVNEYCTFLEIKEGKATCKIYKIRPSVCKEWPKGVVFGMKANDYRCRAFVKPKYGRFL